MTSRVVAAVAAVALSAGLMVTALPAAAADAGNRVAGTNRYETAAHLASLYGQTDTVIIANGEDATQGIDALSANYLAGVTGAPIILTQAGAITPAAIAAVKSALAHSAHPTVYVIGKDASVSASVAAQLSAAAGVSVTRIAGNDRYETAAKIAAVAGRSPGAVALNGTSSLATAILVSGENNADALAAGPLSAAWGLPVILVGPNGLPAASQDAILSLGVKQLLVLGGTDRVSPAVLSAAAQAGAASQQRIAGGNRSATAAQLYELAQTTFTDADGSHYGVGADAGLFLFNGYTGFADALAAGPLAARTQSALVGVSSAQSPQAVRDTVSRLRFSAPTALGSTSSVPASALDSAASAPGTPPPGAGDAGGGTAAPVVSYRPVDKTVSIPRTWESYDDAAYYIGDGWAEEGSDGSKTVHYRQKYVDGVASGDLELLGETITSDPVVGKVYHGTKYPDGSLSEPGDPVFWTFVPAAAAKVAQVVGDYRENNYAKFWADAVADDPSLADELAATPGSATIPVTSSDFSGGADPTTLGAELAGSGYTDPGWPVWLMNDATGSYTDVLDNTVTAIDCGFWVRSDQAAGPYVACTLSKP